MKLPDGFLELPPIVYADDPNWIPEDPRAVAGLFSDRNPWFQVGDADTFCIPGRVRAAVFCQRNLVIDGKRAAFFGFWETTGDAAAEAQVMAQVEAFARKSGAEILYGPIQFATALGYRVLTEHEPAAIPFQGEPWTPLGYGAGLERLGLAVHRRYLTQRMDTDQMRATAEHHRPVCEDLLRRGYRFAPIDPADWMARLPALHRLADVIFAGNFAYTSPSWEQFAALFGERLLASICPETSTLAFGPSGDLAAFFLMYPHYGALAVQSAGAARVELSAMRFDVHVAELRKHGPVGVLFKTIGTTPEHRKHGIARALVTHVLDRCIGRYEFSYPALMREDNISVRLAVSSTNLRSYALYSKTL
jgi:GNAT superfamily N-acetyltransferase